MAVRTWPTKAGHLGVFCEAMPEGLGCFGTDRLLGAVLM